MTITKSLLLPIIFVLSSSGYIVHAQDKITVYPKEYQNALSNPMKGFRPDPNGAGDSEYPYPTIVRDYISWNEIENDASDGVQKIIDVCNKEWAGFEDLNVKVIPRVFIDWDSSDGNEYWPDDLSTGDWSSDEFKERVVKLIYKLGEAWDNDPRVAWVQTGIIGYWGEQESPVGVGSDGWAERLGTAFDEAFNNKKLVVRNQPTWAAEGFEWGVYWDSYGHPGQGPWAWAYIQDANEEGRYLSEVVEGEVAYNWGEDSFDPLYGGEPTITLDDFQYTNNMIDVIRELHCTGLGWIASYDLDGSNGTNPDSVMANASRMQKAFGYRYFIPEFSCSSRADQGGNLNISFKVKNSGSAPFYENWPVALVFIDELTGEIVGKERLSGIDIRNWHPGDKYNYSSRSYEIPAEEYLIETSLTVPSSLPNGQYMLGLSILEPYSETPGIFFAVENFLKESQAQPLCRIGIGEDLTGSYEIDPNLFDDPLNDDNRFYTLTPQGESYSISSDLPNGSLMLKPAGNAYVPGTVVTVEAVGDLGYEFAEWGGNLSGTENSITITMDSDKSISASFNEVPTYEITTSASNGIIILDPPGGVYNEGTTVNIHQEPAFGYQFSEWDGYVTGSDNTISIVMDADKELIANFSFVGSPITSLAINCGGPSFTATDGTFFLADKYFSGGDTYSASDEISGTEDDVLYQSERYGSISYNIDIPNGQYELTLMFAEIYQEESGKRVFDVSVEGLPFITNLDIYDEVGVIAAYDVTKIVDVFGGQLNISLNSIVDNAKISGIKVLSTYDGKAFTLETQSENGTIHSDPLGTKFMENSVITLSAVPDENYEFTEWAGDLSGTENTLTINIMADMSITAIFSETTGIDELEKDGSEQSILLQNYPNPFTSRTTIPYELNEASHVRLTVFNLLGEALTVLIDTYQTAGRYTTEWKGTDNQGKTLTNGVYIYRMEVDNRSVEFRKAIISR